MDVFEMVLVTSTSNTTATSATTIVVVYCYCELLGELPPALFHVKPHDDSRDRYQGIIGNRD